MKRERSGVHLLLLLLLVFSVSVGWLYGDKKSVVPNQNNGRAALATLSTDDALEILLPLVVSRSAEKLIEAMNYIPAQKAHDIIKAIIDTQQFNIMRDDILALIYGLEKYYAQKDEQYSLLDLIVENEKLRKGTPFLFVAAKTFPDVIPLLLAWQMDRQDRHPSFFVDSQIAALRYAVENNASQELENLIKGLSVNSNIATFLLWRALETNTRPEIVKLLIQAGAFVNDNKNGWSPLMKAIDNENFELVKLLIENNANPNALYEPRVGNPLQRILGRKQRGENSLKIELFLREHGARENYSGAADFK